MLNVEFREKRRRRVRVISLAAGLMALSGMALWAWKPSFEWLARKAIHEHREDAALVWLSWSDRFGGESGTAAFLRARAYRHRGEMDASANALLRAKELGISIRRLEREQWLGKAQGGQLREVGQYLSKLLIDPQDDLDEICEAYFLGFIRNQKAAPALELLKNWMLDCPNRARPYVLRARFWNLKLEVAKAQEDLERAVAIEPKNPDAIFELAVTLQQNGRCESAASYFEKSLTDPRYSSRAYVGLAGCFKVLGQSDRIKPLLEKALAISPENSNAYVELGRLEFEADDFTSSIRNFRQAMKLAPTNHEIHFLLAQALTAVNEVEEAKIHFEFVQKFHESAKELIQLEDQLAAKPGDVEKLVRMGEILIEFADPDEGVVRLQAALEIEPRHPKARRLLAEHYKRLATIRPEYKRLAEHYENETE